MKIAFLNVYQKKVKRGSESFVYELQKRFEKNHDVKVFSLESGDFDWNQKDSTGTIARRFFLDYWSRKIAMFTIKAVPEILKEKFDIVFPLNGGWQVAILRIVTWLYGGKMVVSGQSGMGWDDRNNLWSFPNTFVSLSSTALSWAKKANPFVKSVYIPNGVDLNKFKNNDLGLKNKQKTVLSAGAFTEQKRLDLVIEAVAKLKNVKLLIAGGGGDKKEEITEYGLKKLGKERFKVTSVPFEKMPEVYRSVDVFTLPSASTEAFGNVLVEAMATNLPVVVTDDPIRREIVGDAGFFVDPTNTEEYSEKLQKALETNWGDKPRKQAQKFDWDKIAEKYEELFKGIVKNR
jgi:glycosyltransferase involved in cell wall biosynthesis